MRGLFLCLSLLFLVSCNSDPYTLPGELTDYAPKEVEPPYSVESEDILTFKENQESRHVVKGRVTEGEALLTFTNMPDGMTYDTKTQELVWKPDFNAANDPAKPTVKRKVYSVVVVVRSSTNKAVSLKRNLHVVVEDTPRKTTVSRNDNTTAYESRSSSTQFKIVSEDFPRGPFEVFVNGIPGVFVQPVSGYRNYYRASFNPHPSLVDNRDSFSGSYYYKDISGTITVVDPRGNVVNQSFQWKVRDRRLDPIVNAPTRVSQGPEVNFSITSIDANYEVMPKVTVRGPTGGDLDVTRALSRPGNGDQMPLVVDNIRWTNIPQDYFGKSHRVTVSSCTFGNRRRQDLCTEKIIYVTPTQVKKDIPVFTRTNWTLDHVEYLKQQTVVSKTLSIRCQDNFTVKVEPSTMARYVSWSGGVLRANFPTTGRKIFTLRAVTEHGVERSETFVADVLPRNWSSTLVVASSPIDPEVVKTRALMDSSQLLIPGISELTERFLSNRTSLVVTTDSVSSGALNRTLFQSLEQNLDQLIITTPKLKDFDTQSGNAASRWVTYGTPISLADPSLYSIEVNTRYLTRPGSRIFLEGSLTSASGNVQPLNLRNSACQGLMWLNNPTAGTRQMIAATCNRHKVIIAGFEFADLKAENSADQGIIKTWMKGMLQ